MKKRLLAGLTAALLLLALLPTAALAAQAPDLDEAAQVLAAMGIMVGNQNGDMNLGGTVTRAEFTKMLVAASPWKDSVGDSASVSPYPDVPRDNWAAPWVQAAVDHQLVSGYLDGTFRPTSPIKLSEGVVMILRLLGYTTSDFTGAFPAGQMTTYRTLELNRGITIGADDHITRRDALCLFYNLLTTKTKIAISENGASGGVYYLNVIKPNDGLITADGKIDHVALVNSAMDGPVVAGAGWRTKIPFDVGGAAVYRSGALASLDAIRSNDVIYWSAAMRTLWVYNNRATGVFEAVDAPSSPTTVTVAGKTYPIETSAAAYALSDLGGYKVGDTVTLLLGRNNQVAAVLAPSSVEADIYGMVTQVSSAEYTDANGKSYTASTVYVYATDGNTYSYRWDAKDLKPGHFVQVSTGSGDLVIKNLPTSNAVSGKVDSASTRMGKYDFADDIEIMDTYGSGMAKRIYPSRIAGMEITSGMVRYALRNADGKITRLVLKDATGDLHQYGVLLTVSEVNMDMATSGVYTCDIAGQQRVIQSGAVYNNLKPGPIMIKQDGTELDKFVNLTRVSLTSILDHTGYAENREYPISDDVAVYEVKGNDYFISSLSLVSNGDFALSGWYDKPADQGGRIRVILAS